MRRSATVTPWPPTLPRDRREGCRCLGARRADPRPALCSRLVRHSQTAGIVLYLPTLALAEVRAVRPDAGAELAEVLGYSMVVLGELDAANARQVDQMLTSADVFDATAGHVVHIARQRRWPALSADPGRLRSPGHRN